MGEARRRKAAGSYPAEEGERKSLSGAPKTRRGRVAEVFEVPVPIAWLGREVPPPAEKSETVRLKFEIYGRKLYRRNGVTAVQEKDPRIAALVLRWLEERKRQRDAQAERFAEAAAAAEQEAEVEAEQPR